MSASKIEATVRELADKDAIRELAIRYAHCVWQKDAGGVADLFAEDGEMDMGDRPLMRGKQAIREEYQRTITGPDLQPFVHNHLIELHGDQATGSCYIDLRAAMNGKSMIGSGRYDDEYVRERGEWKIRSRTLHLSFFVPVNEGWAKK